MRFRPAGLLVLLFLCRLAYADCKAPPVITDGPRLLSTAPDGRSATWTVSTNVPTTALWYWAPDAGVYDTDSGETDTNGTQTHTYTIAGLFPKNANYDRVYGVGVRLIEVHDGRPCPRTDSNGKHLWTFNDPSLTPNLKMPTAPDGPFDYSLGVVGPRMVFQGTSLYLGIQYLPLTLSYPHKKLRLQVSGPPALLNTVSLHWLDSEFRGATGDVAKVVFGNDSLVPYSPPYRAGFELQIVTSGSTPVGTYNMTLYGCDVSFADCSTASGTGANGVPTHSFPFTINVVPPATFAFGTPSSYPPIPDLNKATRTSPNPSFEETEAKHLSLWCAQDMHGINWNPSSAGLSCVRDQENGGRCLRLTDPDPKQWQPVGMGIQWGTWFYDGEKADYQWSLYTGAEELWDKCRQGTEMVYRDGYMATIKPPAAANGILVFPHGYYLNWLSQGQLTDETSNAGKSWNFIRNMAMNSAHAHPINARAVWMNQRESAYSLNVHHYAALVDPALQTHVLGSKVDKPEAFWETYYGEHVLGFLQQVCIDKNMPEFSLFMVGLQMDALVHWYATSGDLRVPYVVKACVDYLHPTFFNWQGDPHAFPYLKHEMFDLGKYTSNSLAGLNMLSVGAYGWLFSITGDPKYQKWGDELFQWGVKEGGPGLKWGIAPASINGNGGKQTSQFSYTSFDYIRYRTAPPAAPIAAVVPASMMATLQQPFTQPLTATGGYGPYTFDVTKGTLPPGLTITHNTDARHGTISGTPTQEGTYTFTIRAWDKFEDYHSDVNVTMNVAGSGKH